MFIAISNSFRSLKCVCFLNNYSTITGGKLVGFTVLPSNVTLPVTFCMENSSRKKQVKMFFCGKHLQLLHSFKCISSNWNIQVGTCERRNREKDEKVNSQWPPTILLTIKPLFSPCLRLRSQRQSCRCPTAWKCDIYYNQCKITTENQFLITWLES